MAAARRDRRRVLAVTSVLVINAKFNFRALQLLLIFDVSKQPFLQQRETDSRCVHTNLAVLISKMVRDQMCLKLRRPPFLIFQTFGESEVRKASLRQCAKFIGPQYSLDAVCRHYYSGRLLLLLAYWAATYASHQCTRLFLQTE